MKATSQPVKTTNSYEAVEPTDVERDMLNNDGGLEADLDHDILPLKKDQQLFIRIEICLKNKHATFTSSSEASTSSLIKGSLDPTSAPS